MNTYGRLRIPSSRTSSGRKIDTWEFDFPDGTKAEIEVSLRNDRDGPSFMARSAHPLLQNTLWENSDLSALASRVQQDISEIVRETEGDTWQAALAIEVLPETRDVSEQTAGLRISVKPVLRDTREIGSNTAHRMIIENGRRKVFEEQVFVAGSGRDPGTGILLETPRSGALVQDTPDTRSALDCLQSTLECFSRLLAEHLGPDRADDTAIPSPDALEGMMREAVHQVANRGGRDAQEDLAD